LTWRGCAGDPTHALFSGQSQSIRDNVMALFGAIRAWNCSAANLARTGRISAMWNRIPIEQCPGQVGVCYPLDCRPGLSGNIGLTLVESECGAVAVGRTYLFPPLSSGGASLVRPWLRFHTHRVTGGGRPPRFPQNVACGFPAPTLFGSCFTPLQAPAAPGRGGAV
jgi:hypothetical protein